MKRKPDSGPEPIAEILSRLFAARGWGRRQGRLHLERAWAEAAGPDHAELTRVAGLRRGVLEVEVASAVLLQELASFHKRRLLDQLRRRLPGTADRVHRHDGGHDPVGSTSRQPAASLQAAFSPPSTAPRAPRGSRRRGTSPR